MMEAHLKLENSDFFKLKTQMQQILCFEKR